MNFIGLAYKESSTRNCSFIGGFVETILPINRHCWAGVVGEFLLFLKTYPLFSKSKKTEFKISFAHPFWKNPCIS